MVVTNVKEVEIVQGDDARWRWQTSALGAGGVQASVLSFDNRGEAAADAHLHAQAQRDYTGRQVMTKDYLRRLISAITLPCAACADVYFGGIYWHRRGADGANWGVAIMNGAGDHEACLACVHAAREDLRRRYSIVDEA